MQLDVNSILKHSVRRKNQAKHVFKRHPANSPYINHRIGMDLTIINRNAKKRIVKHCIDVKVKIPTIFSKLGKGLSKQKLSDNPKVLSYLSKRKQRDEWILDLNRILEFHYAY